MNSNQELPRSQRGAANPSPNMVRNILGQGCQLLRLELSVEGQICEAKQVSFYLGPTFKKNN